MTTFAKRLRQALDAKGMKQSELVEITGIGKSSISTYLAGEYEAKQHNLYKIAKALDVSEGWLMGLDVPMRYDINISNKTVDYNVSSNNNDVANSLNFLIDKLDKDGAALMFDGEPLDDESKELLKGSIENSLKMGKLIAKQKLNLKD